MTVTRMKPVWMGRMRNPVLAQSEGVVPCTSSGTPQYSPLPAPPPPLSVTHIGMSHILWHTSTSHTTHHHTSSLIITHNHTCEQQPDGEGSAAAHQHQPSPGDRAAACSSARSKGQILLTLLYGRRGYKLCGIYIVVVGQSLVCLYMGSGPTHNDVDSN